MNVVHYGNFVSCDCPEQRTISPRGFLSDNEYANSLIINNNWPLLSKCFPLQK